MRLNVLRQQATCARTRLCCEPHTAVESEEQQRYASSPFVSVFVHAPTLLPCSQLWGKVSQGLPNLGQITMQQLRRPPPPAPREPGPRAVVVERGGLPLHLAVGRAHVSLFRFRCCYRSPRSWQAVIPYFGLRTLFRHVVHVMSAPTYRNDGPRCVSSLFPSLLCSAPFPATARFATGSCVLSSS